MHKDLSIHELTDCYQKLTLQLVEIKQARKEAIELLKEAENPREEMKLYYFIESLQTERKNIIQILRVVADRLPSSEFPILTLIS